MLSRILGKKADPPSFEFMHFNGGFIQQSLCLWIAPTYHSLKVRKCLCKSESDAFRTAYHLHEIIQKKILFFHAYCHCKDHFSELFQLASRNTHIYPRLCDCIANHCTRTNNRVVSNQQSINDYSPCAKHGETPNSASAGNNRFHRDVRKIPHH